MRPDDTTPQTVPFQVDVFTDLVTPWGWVGKRRLEAAIGLYERPHEVTVHYRAWEVDPEAPTGRHPRVNVHDSRALGHTPEGRRLMIVRVDEAATDHALRFDWERVLPANTFDSHRLVALALDLGGPALQSAAVERFFSAHFSEALPIDEPEVLQRVSAEAGLDERRVAEVLEGEAYADQVRVDERRAQELGLEAAPLLIAPGVEPLHGIRPVEDYLSLLREAGARAGSDSASAVP